MRGKPNERRVADEIARALEEALAYAKGGASMAARVHYVQVPDSADVRALRRRLGLTQADFARRSPAGQAVRDVGINRSNAYGVPGMPASPECRWSRP